MLGGNLNIPPGFDVASENNKAGTIFLPVKDSFKFVLWGNLSTPPISDVGSENNSEKISSSGKDKRAFLKVATIAGAGLVASQILPKKAEALIMGSSPTTGVVGVKDSSNTRINPATEETLLDIKNKTENLTFDTGSLQVKVTSLPTESSSFSNSADTPTRALVDDTTRNVQVDVISSALPTTASTETTLQTISFGGFKFALRLATDSGDSNVEYVGEAEIGTLTSENDWRIKKIDSTTGIVIQYAGTGIFNQTWDNRESIVTWG